MKTATPRGRSDFLVAILLLAGLLAWDFSGADLHVTRWFADAHGFASRDSAWASTLLHDGGRWLAWTMALALFAVALRTSSGARDVPGRPERLAWLAVTLLCALAVPSIKHHSATSCPWDLAEFGGTARYLSHWSLDHFDGGSGHCFPSGHAVAAFAFFSMYFQWRGHDPMRARAWLFAVLAAGLLLGIGQLARGAHYPSHTFWSAGVCWAICLGADRLGRRRLLGCAPTTHRVVGQRLGAQRLPLIAAPSPFPAGLKGQQLEEFVKEPARTRRNNERSGARKGLGFHWWWAESRANPSSVAEFPATAKSTGNVPP